MSILLGSAYGKVTLDASGVESGVNKANKSLGTLKNFAEELGAKFQKVGSIMTASISIPLALLGKQAVNTYLEYEKAMNMLSAVTGATAEQMATLSQLAKDLGADMTLPGTSAADAAEAMAELAKAGLDVNEVMAAAKGVLQLSAAGQLGNAEAAVIAANALNVFNLEGSEAVRVADLLAAAANSSSGEVRDMADALQMSASVFATAGMNIEDLVTAISLMSNAGIQGSDAGTSLKQMLLSLQAPSDKASGLMRSLGINIYDASGNMKSMREIIQIFSTQLGGLTQKERNFALATIFGSDAVRAANIVLMGGAEAYDQMYEKVNKVGAAADLTGKLMEGLSGALENLKSAIDTAAIAAIEPLKDDFVVLIDTVSKVLNAFSKLPAPVREFIVKVLLLLIVLGPLLLVFGKALPLVIGGATKSLNPFSGGIFGLIGTIVKWIGVAALIVKALGAMGIATGPAGATIVAVSTAIGGAVTGVFSTVIGAIFTFAATVVLPILVIIATLYLLYKAWETNFGGIRTTLEQMTWLLGKWEYDTVMAFGKWATDMGAAFNVWAETTSMAFQKWVDDTSMKFSKWVDDTLAKFTNWSDAVREKFTNWSNAVREKFNAVGNTAKQLWSIIKWAFDGIVRAIYNVINAARAMDATLRGIKLPANLTPGSPTPFEVGLNGIAGAMGNVTLGAVSMGAALSRAGTSGSNSFRSMGISFSEMKKKVIDNYKTILETQKANIKSSLENQKDFFNNYFENVNKMQKQNTEFQNAAMKAQAAATQASLKAQAEALKQYMAMASEFYSGMGIPMSGGSGGGTPGLPDFSEIPGPIPIEPIEGIVVEQILSAMKQSMNPNAIARSLVKSVQNNNSQQQNFNIELANGLTLRDVDAMISDKINRFSRRVAEGL